MAAYKQVDNLMIVFPKTMLVARKETLEKPCLKPISWPDFLKEVTGDKLGTH